jgi:hypothetical protein
MAGQLGSATPTSGAVPAWGGGEPESSRPPMGRNSGLVETTALGSFLAPEVVVGVPYLAR